VIPKDQIPNPAERRVRVLSEHVARKIAAGEVIDRPFAALRELMDNAIDSGAKEVTAALEGGGIRSIRVTDDGCGMTPEDLEACWLPHATSKIVAVDDLEKSHHSRLSRRGALKSGRLFPSGNHHGPLRKITAPVGSRR
jgi:hypothetical protein